MRNEFGNLSQGACFTSPVVDRVPLLRRINFLLYNLNMNKRAKKRLKEAIEKENLERAKARKEQSPLSPKDQQKRSGFIPKPEKKRG